MSLFRKKSLTHLLAQAADSEKGLKRTLGAGNLIALGIGAIIGAGLFVDNEVGAATSSGVGEEVIRICGTHLVVEYMRQGDHPELACKKAVTRIVERNPDKARQIQVGFAAFNKQGAYGAYAIQKGFVIAVKTAEKDQLIPSKHLL